MPYTDLEKGQIDTSIIYVTRKELMERTGVSGGTIYNYITNNGIEALKYKNRVFFHPDVADEFVALVKCRLIGRG